MPHIGSASAVLPVSGMARLPDERTSVSFDPLILRVEQQDVEGTGGYQS
jgi:hypothetical protein